MHQKLAHEDMHETLQQGVCTSGFRDSGEVWHVRIGLEASVLREWTMTIPALQLLEFLVVP